MKGVVGTPSRVSAYALSVVIPSHNRRAALQRCLQALGRQTTSPATFEVIVADDGSADGTADMLQRVQTPFRLRPLSLPHQGAGAARNAGIAVARGRVCLFLDDDICASPELLAAHAAAHEHDSRIIGIGRLTQQPPTESDWYGRAFARAWNRHYDQLVQRGASWTDCYSGNMSVARDALLEVGGFSADAPVREDGELAFRLCERGYRPQYVPGGHATHADEKRRSRLLEHAERRGAGYVALADRQPAMLPALLGWFGATSSREILLRRLLLVTWVPPMALTLLGPLLPGQGRQETWFEFVSRLTFWRGVRRSVNRRRWRQLTQGVPVLIYHAFDERARGLRFVIARRSFRRQMRLLAALGYRVIPLEELLRALHEHELPPPRAAVITIDDGYRDNMRIAAPVLLGLRYPSTIFLVAGRLGARNNWSQADELTARALLSVRDVSRMAHDGVRFGAHTQTHPMLPEAPDDAIRREIEGARSDLERELGGSLAVFAYPYGEYDDRALAAVRAAYFGACTTEPRLVRLDDDPFLLPRIEIRGTDSLLRFLRKVSFGGS